MVLSPQVITPGWVGLLVFSCSIMSDSVTPWTAACQASLSFTISQSLLKNIKSVMPSNYLILCCLLLLPSVFPRIRVLSNESALNSHQVARVLELQPQHQSFQWIFRVDFLEDWLVWCPCYPRDSQKSFSCTTVWKYQFFGSAFFMVQLSHLHMTTGKTIALTIWTFVSKVISLLFSTLSRFVIAFLPRSKHILISWLQSPSVVILESRNGLVGLVGLNVFL